MLRIKTEKVWHCYQDHIAIQRNPNMENKAFVGSRHSGLTISFVE
jgi:hypothetical protein